MAAGESSFVTVAREDDIREGTTFGVAVGGHAIMLARIGGKIYAMDAVCSHFSGYLPNGELETEYLPDGKVKDNAITCPVHKAKFDLETGKVLKNVPALLKYATHKEATDLRTYEVEVVDKDVRLKVDFGQARPE